MKELNDTRKAARYLKYGYYWPDDALTRDPIWLQACYSRQFGEPQYTPEEVRDLLRRILSQHLQGLPSGANCIIPLSGGLDSRLLLGEALYFLPSNQVKTVTFGNPGQLDYDLGIQVAREVGVENIPIELNSLEVSWEAIMGSAKRSPWTYLPDSLFNEHARSAIASSSDYILSGFLGDPTTGGHIFSKRCGQVENEFFLQQFRGSASYHRARGHQLAEPNGNSLPTGTSNAETNWLYLDLEVRQRYCVAPITTGVKDLGDWDCDIGQCQSTGARIKAPFAAPEWIAYWHGAPNSKKLNQSLYRAFMKMAHPALEDVGTKDNLGVRSKNSVGYFLRLFWFGSKFLMDRVQNRKALFYEKLNYVDYRWKLRHSDGYREVLHMSAEVLLENGVIEEFSYEHRVLVDPRYIDPESVLVLVGCAANIVINGT